MRIKVWDLPTRIFHWLLFVTVVAALITGLQGGNWMVWHGRIGLTILYLLVFRLIWGLLGSTYARFWQFFPTPGRLIAYFKGRWNGVGHNPIGAFSVFALLGVLTWQVGSGLFANDDIAFDGPLYPLVSKATSDWLTSWHRTTMWVVIGLVSLHVLAILFYRLVRGKDLVTPMVRGWKEMDGEGVRSARGGQLWALLLALILSGVAVWAASGALLPPPPPPVVPAW